MPVFQRFPPLAVGPAVLAVGLFLGLPLSGLHFGLVPAVVGQEPTPADPKTNPDYRPPGNPGTSSIEAKGPFDFGNLNLGSLNNRQFALQETPAQFQPMLVDTILDLVPNEYESTKHWGGTKEIVSGLDVKMRDGRLRTKRRRKDVNHGTWKRYNVTLVDPKEYFEIQVVNLVESSPGTATFDLVVRAKLDVYGRLQEWKRGVRLFSISAEAVADVELKLACQLTTKLDASHFPPDVLLRPTVANAESKLTQFKLRRLSKADGPIVREFGDGLEKILRKKLAEKDDKLASKINRQIQKNKDDLRLSVRDMVSSGLFGGSDEPASDAAP